MTPGKVHDDEEGLRKHCLSYPEAVEDLPWGHSAFKVAGKAFCFMSKAEPELSLSAKLPQSNSMALSFQFAEPTHYGLGKSGWVTATFAGGTRAPLALMKEWIEESYRAIAPAKLVAVLDAHARPAVVPRAAVVTPAAVVTRAAVVPRAAVVTPAAVKVAKNKPVKKAATKKPVKKKPAKKAATKAATAKKAGAKARKR